MRVQAVKGLPSVGVIRPEGPIDFRNVGELRDVADAARRRGRRMVVLDLSETRYINSLGMSFLISLSDALAVDGGALLLAAATPKLKVVLDLMGIAAVLPLHGTVVAAVRSAVKRRPRQRAGSR
jgi:anti-sigma B factor antagonist